MRYIERDDLKTDSQDRFIVDSTADNPEAIDKIVSQTVDIVITYIDDRYNTDKIFDPVEPIRNEVLVDIICKIALFKIFGRNAARKLTTDIKENYTAAMKSLTDINSGKLKLAGLPVQESEDPDTDSDLIMGNLSNPKFYI